MHSVCAGCLERHPIVFIIRRVNQQGQFSPERFDLCSLVCVFRWGYRWGSDQGKRAAGALEATINDIARALRG